MLVRFVLVGDCESRLLGESRVVDSVPGVGESVRVPFSWVVGNGHRLYVVRAVEHLIELEQEVTLFISRPTATETDEMLSMVVGHVES